MQNPLVDLNAPSATKLLALLTAKKVSSIELVKASIARIEKLDGKINAVVIRDFERALTTAREADKAIARGEHRPLLGLPMTVKESFNLKGLSTSWGNPAYKDWQPAEDSLAVARLKAAGAIILAKTNVPFMLSDWQSFNAIYGTTNNPWNVNLTSGGSSGGAAAALAAGFVPLELGSDMAGSLRVPAHYCGVYAHRPSLDLIPMRGTEPPTLPSPPGPRLNDFAVAGPMARTADDLKLALDILAGPDEQYNGHAYQLALPKARHKKLADFRVLILREHPHCPLGQDVSDALDTFAAHLKETGVAVSYDSPQLPSLEVITQTYAALLAAFAAGKMPAGQYEEALCRAKAIPADDLSFQACFQRGLGLTHRQWQAVTQQRKILQEQWRLLFNDVDVVLQPAAPTVALPHDHLPIHERTVTINNQTLPYTSQHVWASISSLSGLPATVMPIGYAPTGLPIGIQVIGPYLEDYTPLAFAQLSEALRT